MAKNTKAGKDEVLQQADVLLDLIAVLGDETARLEKEMNREIEAIVRWYEVRIEPKRQAVAADEKRLKKLARTHKAVLFADTDRVDLAHGALIRQVSNKVKKIKGMLAKLKKAKFTEAVKVVESVNWDEVEKWQEDRLTLLGTARVRKEAFVYEVKSGSKLKAEGSRQRKGKK